MATIRLLVVLAAPTNLLSNWYSCEVNYKGHTFNSVEQGYQWSKATFANDVAAARNLLYTTDPREAKDLESYARYVPNWKIKMLLFCFSDLCIPVLLQ